SRLGILMGSSFPLTPACATLVELLRDRANRTLDRAAFSFLSDAETVKETLTYGELDERARAVAAVLQSRGLAGERALLLCPPGLAYAAACFGCLYAGVAAAPLSPPRRARGLDRLHAVIADAQAAAVIAPATVAAAMRSLDQRLQLGGLHWVILN